MGDGERLKITVKRKPNLKEFLPGFFLSAILCTTMTVSIFLPLALVLSFAEGTPGDFKLSQEILILIAVSAVLSTGWFLYRVMVQGRMGTLDWYLASAAIIILLPISWLVVFAMFPQAGLIEMNIQLAILWGLGYSLKRELN